MASEARAPPCGILFEWLRRAASGTCSSHLSPLAWLVRTSFGPIPRLRASSLPRLRASPGACGPPPCLACGPMDRARDIWAPGAQGRRGRLRSAMLVCAFVYVCMLTSHFGPAWFDGSCGTWGGFMAVGAQGPGSCGMGRPSAS